MRRIPTLAALTLVAFSTGCGSAPAGTASPGTIDRVSVSSLGGTVTGTRSYAEPGSTVDFPDHDTDAVWAVVPEVYQLLEIPEAGAAPDQLLYGVQELRTRRIADARLSTYIDCGTGVTATPRADEYDVRMTILTSVRSSAEGGALLETTVRATARPRGTSGHPVDCSSRGVLEADIASLVGDLLSGEQG